MNYNHVNYVDFHQGKFYVDLNWFTRRQYGPSGVAVYDENWRELERFKFGWESHGFKVKDGHKYALCGSSGAIKEINHPHKAGLMVDGKLVFEHDPSVLFAKDFCVSDDKIVIVGGAVEKRCSRKSSDGIIFILDRDFNLQTKRSFESTGGFKGVIL